MQYTQYTIILLGVQSYARPDHTRCTIIPYTCKYLAHDPIPCIVHVPTRCANIHNG